MSNMKVGYLVIFGFLVLILVVLTLATTVLVGLVLLTRSTISFSLLGQAIQAVVAVTALLAAVIALSAADPKKRKAAFSVRADVDENSGHLHTQSTVRPVDRDAYAHLGEEFESQKVLLHIRNTSGFALEQPTIIFRVPTTKRHPETSESPGEYRALTLNSNFYNTDKNLTKLETPEYLFLSNSIVPFWEDALEITYWIRMVLDAGKPGPFEVAVSLHSRNAQGTTRMVTVPVS
jgi:hypothetical protein